jgi:hypothetical protein
LVWFGGLPLARKPSLFVQLQATACLQYYLCDKASKAGLAKCEAKANPKLMTRIRRNTSLADE